MSFVKYQDWAPKFDKDATPSEVAEASGELEDWLNDSLLEAHGAGLEVKRVRIEVHVGVKQ